MSDFILTKSALIAALPNATPKNIDRYFHCLHDAMLTYDITTPRRAAMFIAQLAHESASLRYDEEIWTNSPAQRRYEPPGNTAVALGNTQPGDGFRYRGRGLIQLTGRANYKTYGDLLNLPLEDNPDLAKSSPASCNIAGAFFQRNRLNTLADNADLYSVTRRINGGLNGIRQRLKHYALACNAFNAACTDTLSE
jgi:predicted chitinase